jgi:hypothetical protein
MSGKTATQVYIDLAAAMMAKEIDAHILHTTMKDTKQWKMLPIKP